MSSARKEVEAHLIEIACSALTQGKDAVTAIRDQFPGVPLMVAVLAAAEADHQAENAWWDSVEKTIDGEIIKNALTNSWSASRRRRSSSPPALTINPIVEIEPMTALLHSTASNPTSAGITPEIAGISPKGLTASEFSDTMRIFMSLSAEGKQAAIRVAEWLVHDRRPETDPRQLDPYWQSFPESRAVKVA